MGGGNATEFSTNSWADVGSNQLSSAAKGLTAGLATGLEAGAATSCSWVRNYMSTSSGSHAGAAMISSNLRSLMTGCMALFSAGMAARAILASGYEAMSAPREQVKVLASSHAYARWLFEHRQFPTPSVRPESLAAIHRADDRQDNHGQISSAEFARIWRSEVNSSVVKLNTAYRSLQVDRIRRALLERLPNAQVHEMSPAQCRRLLKVLSCSDFDQDPGVAAAAFLLLRIRQKSDSERQAITNMYRNHPYRGS